MSGEAEKSGQDLDARYEKEREVKSSWQTPEYITWVLALLIWYLLNSFVIRQTFNPYYPNPQLHEWYDEDSRKWWDDWGILWGDDESPYYLPEKWRDPKTKRVFHINHPDVISGIRKEKFFRGLFTFLCGLPVVGFYYHRTRQYDTDPEYLRGKLEVGLLWCGGVALVMGVAGDLAWNLAQTVESLICCVVIVLPFLLWPKRHLLFGKKKS